MSLSVIVVIVLVVVALIGVAFYNRIIVLENRVRNAFAQVDVQLKRRADLVPNLVATVKGYAAHESAVFEQVTRAREHVLSAPGVTEKAAANAELSAALRSVFAIAEAYPDLKASQNFTALQAELANVEDKIAYSRQFYNDTVLEYNNAITTVPGAFIAPAMGKTPQPSFAAEDADRAVPAVNF